MKAFRMPRKRNLATAKAYARTYYRAHKDRFVFKALIRSHRKAGLAADLTASDWSNALEHFGHACAYCGSTGHLQKEHVIPVASGGGLTRCNIVPACVPCNQSKKHRALHDWYKFTEGYSDRRLLAIVGWIFGPSGVAEVRQRFNLAI